MHSKEEHSMELTDDRARRMEYIERWGVVFEQLGSTRMVGKILGWLMVADPVHQSASQIAEGIGASAASVSTGTRALLQMGMIERVGLRGQRSVHYRVGKSWWGVLVDKRIRQTVALRELAENGLDLVGPDNAASSSRLRDFAEYCTFMETELPALVRRWDRERRRSA